MARPAFRVELHIDYECPQTGKDVLDFVVGREGLGTVREACGAMPDAPDSVWAIVSSCPACGQEHAVELKPCS